MRLFSGNKNKVIVSKEEILDFNNHWPCSELRSNRAYWFEFAENGDLIDTDVPPQDDGPAATALSQDAKEFWEDNR